MGKSKKKPAWVIAQQANKPKVPLPPGMTKNMMKPTGFEDYFTEAPLTPAEHVEERKMYDPEERFDHRLQTAIYRYTQRRKFHQSYANIFEMFLKYGGVDTGPNQHVGGVSEQELEDYTAQELAMIKCRYQVGDDKDPDEGKWVVDFEGVAKGFLSSQLPVRISPSEYGLATKILTNFYNYLLLHDVFCKTTEGDLIDSIKAARDVCALAADELPRVSQAGLLLPGDFNVAASVLTGGHFEGLFAGDSAWAKETQENIYGDEVWGSSGGAGPGMPDSKARLVLAMGIMVNGSQELYEDMIALEGDWHCHLVVAKTKSIGLEITRIEFPEAEARSLYQDDEMRKKVTLQPVGKLFCKEWHAPDFFQTWDLAPRSTDGDGQEAEYEFWTEENILTTLFVGMKMEATIRRLQLDEDTGFWQLDTVSRAYCSFFTYLPNELVIKPIKTVEWAAEGEVGGEEEGAGVEE